MHKQQETLSTWGLGGTSCKAAEPLLVKRQRGVYVGTGGARVSRHTRAPPAGETPEMLRGGPGLWPAKQDGS